MTKEELIGAVADDTGFSRTIVAKVIDETLLNITWALSKGDKVTFAGFGTFAPTLRAARTGRNPHTKEKVAIPSRIMPTFTAGSNLKSAVIQTVERGN